MSRRTTSLQSSSVSINRDIGSSYDKVRIVADNIDGVTALSDNMTDIQQLALNIADVTAVGPNIADIQNVNTNIADVVTVATSIADVSTVAANIVDVQNAIVSQAAAAISQAAASVSETNAANSATAASSSETAAGVSAINAANSETAAGNSETNAAASATAASDSEAAAANSESAASTSETNAAASEAAAAVSETNAANSASAAASSLASVELVFDSFDDRYLGAKAADPALDNDGNGLIAGAVYWNTSTTSLRFYNGAAWEDPEASAYSSAVAAAASEAAAAASETAAASSETNASTSETNAAASETAASTSETNAAASEAAAAVSETNAAASEAVAAGALSATASNASAASTSAAEAAASAASITGSVTQAETAAAAAQLAESNAVAVVSGGTASLTSAAGKIPIAGADGLIDDAWLSYNIPGVEEVLSGFNVVSAFYYDTTKDSDGGAWTKRTGSLSYGKEAVPSGRYVGVYATHQLARVDGAVAGDWFYDNVNLRFRELVSTDSDKAIYRAGSATFPTQALIVAISNVCYIFDCTGPETTMWMVMNGNNKVTNTAFYSLDTYSEVKAVEGYIFLAAADVTGLKSINFTEDYIYSYRYAVSNSYQGKFKGRIGDRHTQLGYDNTIPSGGTIVSHNVNAVAVTTLESTPVNPATGLKTPTVAVATNGGVSIIKDDGTVVDIVDSSAYKNVDHVAFDEHNNIIFSNRDSSVVGNSRHYQIAEIPDADVTGSLLRDLYPYYVPTINGFAGGSKFAGKLIGESYDSTGIATLVADAVGTNLGLTRIHNSDSLTENMVAHITDDYNTGWMVGDIQLATLNDTALGNTDDDYLVLGGDFDADLTGWTTPTVEALSNTDGDVELTMPPVIHLDGLTGYLSTPDNPSLELTGDIQIWTFYDVALADFTPITLQVLAGQWDTGTDQRSWVISIDQSPTGRIQVSHSSNGTGANAANSSIATGFSDGASYDLQIVYNSVEQEFLFYTCEAGGVLTQLGDPVPTTASFYNSTADLVLGCTVNSGTVVNPSVGTLRRFTLHDGTITGTEFLPENELLSESAKTINLTDWSKTGAGTVTNNGDGTVTLDDTGAVVNQCRIGYSVSVVDNESTQATFSLSQGTAASTQVQLQYVGGSSTIFSRVTIDWADPLNPTTSNGAAVTVVDLGGGVYEYTMQSTNNATGNNSLNYVFYPASSAADVTGSVTVVGEVSLIQGTDVVDYRLVTCSNAADGRGKGSGESFDTNHGDNIYGKSDAVNGVLSVGDWDGAKSSGGDTPVPAAVVDAESPTGFSLLIDNSSQGSPGGGSGAVLASAVAGLLHGNEYIMHVTAKVNTGSNPVNFNMSDSSGGQGGSAQIDMGTFPTDNYDEYVTVAFNKFTYDSAKPYIYFHESGGSNLININVADIHFESVTPWTLNGTAHIKPIVEDSYAYFDGTGYLSTPDNPNLESTGNVQTWTFYGVRAVDWTTLQVISSQWAASQKSWLFRIEDSGAIGVYFSRNGTINSSLTTSVVAPFVAGSSYDIRISRTSATGEVIVSTAPAGGEFSQLGTALSDTAGTLHNSTADLTFGQLESANYFNGFMRRFTLQDGSLPAGVDFGQELITNGTFDGGDITGWSADRGAVLSADIGGIKVEVSDDTSPSAYQVITTEAGIEYEVSFDVVALGSANGVFRVRDASNIGSVLLETAPLGITAKATYKFTAESAVTCLQLACNSGTATASTTFDNISIKPAARMAVDIDVATATTKLVDGDSFFGAEMLTPSARTINDADWTQAGTGSITNNGDYVTANDTDTSNGLYRVQIIEGTSNSESHQITIEAKQNTAAEFKVEVVFFGGTSFVAGFTIPWSDPLNPSSDSTGGVVATALGGGWYRYQTIVTNDATGNDEVRFRVYPAGSAINVTGATDFKNNVSLQSQWTLNGGVVIQPGTPNAQWASREIQTENGIPYNISALTRQGTSALPTGVRLGTSIGDNSIAEITNSTTTDAEGSVEFVGNGSTVTLSLLGQEDGTVFYNDLVLNKKIQDRSGNNNHLRVHGQLTRSVVGDGEIAVWSGFTTDNFLSLATHNADYNFGTGDFCISAWAVAVPGVNRTIVDRNNTANLQWRLLINNAEAVEFRVGTTTITSPSSIGHNRWVHLIGLRRGGVLELYIDGVLVATGSDTTDVDAVDSSIGIGINSALLINPFTGSLALLRISGSAPSFAQVQKMYLDEKRMFDGKAVLDGSDPSIKALAYDKSQDLLHAASAGVISSFRGLERVESTLDTAVSLAALTFIDSAGVTTTSGEVITLARDAEVDAPYSNNTAVNFTVGVPVTLITNVRAKAGAGSKKLRIDNSDVQTLSNGVNVYTFTPDSSSHNIGMKDYGGGGDYISASIHVVAQSPAPFTSLSADEGILIAGGSNGVDVSMPPVSIRERMAKTLSDRRDEYLDVWLEDMAPNGKVVSGTTVGWYSSLPDRLSLSVVSGKIRATKLASGWAAVLGEIMPTVIGKSYTFRVTVDATFAAGTVNIRVAGASTVVQQSIASGTSEQEYIFDYVATATTARLNVELQTNSASAYVDVTYWVYPTEGLRLPTGYKPERVEIDRQTARESKGNNVYDYDAVFDGFDWIVKPTATYNEIYARAKRVK